MEEVFGYIESIVFAGEENGFTVARLKEPKKREPTVIVGALPTLQPGASIPRSGRGGMLIRSMACSSRCAPSR